MRRRRPSPGRAPGREPRRGRSRRGRAAGHRRRSTCTRLSGTEKHAASCLSGFRSGSRWFWIVCRYQPGRFRGPGARPRRASEAAADEGRTRSASSAAPSARLLSGACSGRPQTRRERGMPRSRGVPRLGSRTADRRRSRARLTTRRDPERREQCLLPRTRIAPDETVVTSAAPQLPPALPRSRLEDEDGRERREAEEAEVDLQEKSSAPTNAAAVSGSARSRAVRAEEPERRRPASRPPRLSNIGQVDISRSIGDRRTNGPRGRRARAVSTRRRRPQRARRREERHRGAVRAIRHGEARKLSRRTRARPKQLRSTARRRGRRAAPTSARSEDVAERVDRDGGARGRRRGRVR